MTSTTVNTHWHVTAHAVELAAILVIVLQIAPARAQSNDDRTRAVETLKNCQLEAASYVVRSLGEKGSANDHRQSLTLVPNSVLKWQNTVDKNVHGNIFVWTRNGRPELVSSIFQFYSPRVEFAAEFQSLSLGQLTMQKDGQTVWTPKEPGLVLHPFDEAAPPSDSKPQRLRQMRQLAEQFTAEITTWAGKTYRMRLMPQPLFRYDSTDPQLLDGTLFAFTYTTDPDVLVVIEAHKSDDGVRWMFGHARMHSGTLTVSYHDREVWNAEQLQPPVYFRDGSYTMFKELPLPKTKDKTD